MLKPLTIVALLAFSIPAMADNFATCLLDKLPGLANDPAAHAATQVCLGEHPGGMNVVRQGVGRGFWSYDSSAECALDNSASTPSRLAAYRIRLACNKLYDEPVIFDQATAVIDK